MPSTRRNPPVRIGVPPGAAREFTKLFSDVGGLPATPAPAPAPAFAPGDPIA